MSHTQLSHHAQVHHVNDANALREAISIARSGDTISLGKTGDYGDIRLVNKSGIRLTSRSKQLAIQATLSVDGTCNDIVIENLNLWNNNHSKKQILLVGAQSKDITIRHCILSSFPVSMNTLRDRLSGKPKSWINGIRLLGNNCKVTDNIIVNVKLGIQANSLDSVLTSNIIQYFSDDAIRVQQHSIQLRNNHIYDSVLSHSADTLPRDAIKLIPPEHRFKGGKLRNIEIVSNIIRSQSRSTSVPKHLQGTLHGIAARDGYFVNITVEKNSIVLNSHYGIVFNGVYQLELSDNKVLAAPEHHLATPAIILYLTCITTSTPYTQKWLDSIPYSVRYGKNQAPLFNVPSDVYVCEDLGQNYFKKKTHDLTQEEHPEFVQNAVGTVDGVDDIHAATLSANDASLAHNTTIETESEDDDSGECGLVFPPSLPEASQKATQRTARKDIQNDIQEVGDISTPDIKSVDVPVLHNPISTKKAKPIAASRKEVASPPVNSNRHTASRSSKVSISASVRQVSNAEQLTRAIADAVPGDTILITHSGNYGQVRITNKTRLRIKSFNTDIPIQATFVIDGSSRLILIENMQLWNDNVSKRQIIITGQSTDSILVRHCIISTVRVNRNTMRRRYSGNPQQWINGIRMLGSNGQIISNYLMNLNMAISQTGPNTLVQHNLVQFYSEDAMRASNHGVKILHNNIYDSVAAHPGQNAHKDAIQLIPPRDRYNAGKLVNVQIIGNIIQSFTQPPSVPAHQRGTVQGIFGSDGYFINTTISGNTVMVNSDHGITLNGVRNLKLIDNNIVDLSTNNQFTPGIKLYLTRVSQHGQQKWLANRPYSLRMQHNQAPLLNIPNEAYDIDDAGNNHFAKRSHDLARGVNPIIIRNRLEPQQPAIPPATPPTDSSIGHTGSAVSAFSITNRDELQRAIHASSSGDTLVFEQSGHYGLIRITNKTGLRIRAAHSGITINANFLLDGQSKNIIIENLNIWFSERDWKPVILTGPETANMTIRNCLISSYQVTRSNARTQMTGTPANWVTGIWLRGRGNEVINNHITNVRVGIAINGMHTLLQNNLIQYYTDTGIRAINDHLEIVHNNIYDAISRKPNSKRLATGIQLIPAKDRFDGGMIKNIQITHNVIQATNSGSPTPEELQAPLQGISMHDGYISGMVINSNTVIVNTEYGITLNGASGLSLNGNRVFDSRPTDNFIPGIRIYYTRTIDINGSREQVWRSGRNYSISYSSNQAAVFNIPDTGYEINDGGDNRFGRISYDKARGFDPIIVP